MIVTMLSAFVFILVVFRHGSAEELCVSETFFRSCQQGEVVFVDSASFGQYKHSRCHSATNNARECVVDVKKTLHDTFGLKQNLTFSVAHPLINKQLPSCVEGAPSIQVVHHCAQVITQEKCNGNSESLKCSDSSSIMIESAYFGRFRRSKCINWDTVNIGCYADVKLNLADQCNSKSECSMLGTVESLRSAPTNCSGHLQSYLDVSFICVHGPMSVSSGNQCSPPIPSNDVQLNKTNNGFRVICHNDTETSTTMRCINGKWDLDLNQFCPRAESQANIDAANRTSAVIAVVVVPLILIMFIVGFFVYKRNCKRSGTIVVRNEISSTFEAQSQKLTEASPEVQRQSNTYEQLDMESAFKKAATAPNQNFAGEDLATGENYAALRPVDGATVYATVRCDKITEDDEYVQCSETVNVYETSIVYG